MSIIESLTTSHVFVDGPQFATAESFWREIQFKLGLPKSCASEEDLADCLADLSDPARNASRHFSLGPGQRLIIEVHNAISNTKQIRSQKKAAKDQGKEHVIITGKKTKVSKKAKKGSKVVEREDLGPGGGGSG